MAFSCGYDGDCLLEGGVLRCGEQHARKAGLYGDLRELAADVREHDARFVVAKPAGGARRWGMGDSAKLEQLAQALVDHCGARRVEERETLHVAELEVEHREYHAGERRAQHFWWSVFVARVEVLLRVEAHARSRANASAASCALACGCLRYWLDLQALHLRAVHVSRDAREAGIDHASYAGNRHGGFGDVRGEDDAAARGGVEGAALFGGGKGCEKGDDVVVGA